MHLHYIAVYPLFIIFYVGFLFFYAPADATFTGTPDLTPPSEVQSNVSNNHDSRFNIIAGSSFSVSCDDVQHTSDPFDVDFYKDDLTSPITNETLADTFITVTRNTDSATNRTSVNVTLTFKDFQPAHNGRYICQANTTDGSESTQIGHALYGTGEQCHCVYMTDCDVCVIHDS